MMTQAIDAISDYGPLKTAQSRFCGMTTFMPQPVQNTELAPKRYGINAVGIFKEYPEEDRTNL